MIGTTALRIAAGLAVALSLPIAVLAGDPGGPVHGADYTTDGRLIPPSDYREWVFLGSGLDMSYDAKATASSAPVFDNVFAEPSAYRVFRATGLWPEGTQLAAEVRGSSGHGSINRRGRYQNGAVDSVELHVKDRSRFEGGWAFFEIEANKPAVQIATSEDCYACHRANAAVDTTFVQFYPTLLPIARARATLDPAYLKAEAEAAARSRTNR